jgi:hypothetical protein
MRFATEALLRSRPEWLPDALAAAIFLTLAGYPIYFCFFRDQKGL